MDYLSNLLGKKKGSGGSPVKGETSNNYNNNSHSDTMMMNNDEEGGAAATATAYNNTSSSPRGKKKKQQLLIAMMNDYTTKIVRVYVNNQEIVSSGNSGGRADYYLEEELDNDNDEMMRLDDDEDDDLEEEGEPLMMMTGNNGGIDIERSTSGSTNTSIIDGMEGGANNNAASADENIKNMSQPPTLSRQTSISSTAEEQQPPPLTDTANDDTAAAADDDAATPTDVNKTASSTSDPSNKFEASLLLGIAENLIGIGVDDENQKRDPNNHLSTLPSSMTAFLDLLSEDQRRKRHRHIPAVEGFRRLYKNEIKVDMAAARVLNRKRTSISNVDAADETMEDTALGTLDEEDGGDEANSGGGTATTTTSSSNSDNEIIAASDKKYAVPDKMAFIVPSEDAMALANAGRLASLMLNTPFENSIKGPDGVTAAGSGASSSPGTVTRSPQLVDSLTAFNPPRPQESTASKTKHRMKRWEANPSEVEVDLSNYRKTVQRTREELQAAENERGRIELVSAIMREHFQKHLIAYKEEIMALYDQLLETNMGCMKADERYNIVRSMSLRGSGKSLKDVLVTLTALEDELKNVAEYGSDGNNERAASLSKSSLDWRVPGVGGIITPGSKAEMASGWILEGDSVITLSGEEGEVIEVNVVPAHDDVADAKKDESAEKSSAPDKEDGVDAMDVDKPKDEEKKDSTETPIKANDDGTKSGDAYVLVEKISVRLSNGDVKVYNSSELKFNPKKLPTLTHLNKELTKRWGAMLKTAEAGKLSHDFSAMDNYINASFATDDSEDGNNSPVTGDEQMILPFGSDFMAAPESVRTFPSLIPPDTLEETVRKVVYEMTTPRIIPDMPADLKKYESQKEELNQYQAKVMQLRHRLGRQKRFRRLNERALTEGKSRSYKVEKLLLEMQMDLKNLKDRLQGELSELGISNAVFWNGADGDGAKAGESPSELNSAMHAAEVGLINNVETALEPESKRLRIE